MLRRCKDFFANTLTHPYMIAGIASALKLFTTAGDTTFRSRDTAKFIYGSDDLQDPVVSYTVYAAIAVGTSVLMLTLVPLTFNQCRKKESRQINNEDSIDQNQNQSFAQYHLKQKISYCYFGGMGLISLGFITFSAYNGSLRAYDLILGEDIDANHETAQIFLALIAAAAQTLPNYVANQVDVLTNAVSPYPIIKCNRKALKANLHVIFDVTAAGFLSYQGAWSAIGKIPSSWRPVGEAANCIAFVALASASSTRAIKNGLAIHKLYENQFTTLYETSSSCSLTTLHHTITGAVAIPDAIFTGTNTMGSAVSFFKRQGVSAKHPLVAGTTLVAGLTFGVSTYANSLRQREKVLDIINKRERHGEENCLLLTDIPKKSTYNTLGSDSV